MIIQDINKLKEFIDWLPDLKNDEKFLLCLFARDKYNKKNKIKGGSFQLQRFVVDKNKMINKIKRLESYLHLLEINNEQVDNSIIGLYIKTNPTSMSRASLMFSREIISKTLSDNNSYNPEVLLMDCIQNTNYNSIYTDIDIDINNTNIKIEDVIDTLMMSNFINNNSWINNIIKTKGGFHIQINNSLIDDEYKKTWRNKLMKLKCNDFDITMNGKNMIPLPGCNQFNYTPELITL